ncbi:MAG TPA: GNAT family N-acetyltransferase, partial [Polyangiaceae bacterium]
MSAGWSRERLLREVVESPRRAFIPIEGTRVIERSGWLQLITPSFPRGGFNDVARAELADDEADSVIDSTIAEYVKLGLEFRWIVGPDSRPTDLAERLDRRGLVRHQVSGMVRVLDGYQEPVADRSIAVESIDLSNESEFSRVTALGWKMDRESLSAYHRQVLSPVGHRHHLFLARLDGEAVGSASFVAGDYSAYLMGGVVLSPFRGRGIYRALVAARVRGAKQLGLSLATCQAGKMSAP